LRPSLGGKLGGEPKLIPYIKKVFFIVQEQHNDEELKILSHFYAGKPLRKQTLEDFFGSYTEPFSVLSVVLDS
jgi:hypothetical protein